MKKTLGLFLVLALVLASVSVYAEARPSPDGRDVFRPVSGEQDNETTTTSTATTDVPYDTLLSEFTAEDGSVDVDGFVDTLGFDSIDTTGTVYNREYLLVRNGVRYYVLVSGTVIWVIYETDDGLVCKTQIVTDPNAFDYETFTKLVYYLATSEVIDAREFDVPYDYSYELYINSEIPLDEDGHVVLSDLDSDKIVDLRQIKAS